MDLKKPDIAAILGKLSFLKNNLSILIPIVIVIIAVLLFIPRWWISGKLRDEVKVKSINQGNTLKSLHNSAVSKKQWTLEQQYQEAYARDANMIELMASQTTMRSLLSYKVFPSPKETSVLIFEEFGQQFTSGIERLVTTMRGRDCPTEAELEEHIPDLSRSSAYGLDNISAMQGGVMDSARQMQERLVDAICRERAMSSGIYINPTNVAGYTFWVNYKYNAGLEKAIEDCWFWQLGYYIVEDVLETARACNAGSTSVLNAPVKRIRRIGFDRNADTYGQRGMGLGLSELGLGLAPTKKQVHVRPHYVKVLQDSLALPCTARLCDDNIDVVHFDLVVILRADYMLHFMKQLCLAKEHTFTGYQNQEQEQILKHNQISILESYIRSVDKQDSTHTYYRYGDDAIIELDLICEYVFVRSGYDPIKPEALK